jgi:hypothetical protein
MTCSKKEGYFLLFFAAEDIARDLKPWLVPLRSAADWIRLAAPGVMEPFFPTCFTSLLRVVGEVAGNAILRLFQRGAITLFWRTVSAFALSISCAKFAVGCQAYSTVLPFCSCHRTTLR